MDDIKEMSVEQVQEMPADERRELLTKAIDKATTGSLEAIQFLLGDAMPVYLATLGNDDATRMGEVTHKFLAAAGIIRSSMQMNSQLLELGMSVLDKEQQKTEAEEEQADG